MSDAENRTLTDKFMLRLPDGMRESIKAKADAANRSMNAEIVVALEHWLALKPQRSPDEIERHNLQTMLAALEKQRAATNHQLTEIMEKLQRLEAKK